jgi:diaminopimelate epimerase
MMDEVAAIRMCVDPTEVILIADAMTRQDAVRAAEEFHVRVPLSRVWEAGASWTLSSGPACAVVVPRLHGRV